MRYADISETDCGDRFLLEAAWGMCSPPFPVVGSEWRVKLSLPRSPIIFEGHDPRCTPPRHGDVDDRAEEEEHDELGQTAFHDNKRILLSEPGCLSPEADLIHSRSCAISSAAPIRPAPGLGTGRL